MSLISDKGTLEGRFLKSGDAIRLMVQGQWMYGYVEKFFDCAYFVSEKLKENDGIMIAPEMEASFIKSSEKHQNLVLQPFPISWND